MTYLGNTPTTQNFISGTDYFNGTGAQTAFTLSRTVNSVNDIQVVVNNVVQQPNDAYTLSGTTLTMTSAPSAGTNNVYVRYLSTTTQVITPSQNTVSWNTLDTNTQNDLGLMYKNRIINGNMVIDQRNAGAAVTVNSSTVTFGVDRFYGQANGGGVFTMQQSSIAPTGFSNSSVITVTTTDSSLTSTDFYVFSTNIEGFNSADLNFGSSSASTVTISFRVRSSVTGTFSGGLCNGGLDRGYPFQFVINSANTWETKSVTIAGDTTGTYLTNNGAGLRLYFNLGSGSNRVGTVNTWGTGWLIATSGATNLMATNGATFYITGVQLEVGTQATAFSTAGGSYGAELALCQRYFYKAVPTVTNGLYGYGFCQGGDSAGFNVQYAVTMRTNPSFSSSGAFISQTSATNGFPTSLSLQVSSNSCASVITTGASGLTTGDGARLLDRTDGSSSLSFSAEL